MLHPAVPDSLSPQARFMSQFLTDLYSNVGIFLFPFLTPFPESCCPFHSHHHGLHLQVCDSPYRNILFFSTFSVNSHPDLPWELLLVLPPKYWVSACIWTSLEDFHPQWCKEKGGTRYIHTHRAKGSNCPQSGINGTGKGNPLQHHSSESFRQVTNIMNVLIMLLIFYLRASRCSTQSLSSGTLHLAIFLSTSCGMIHSLQVQPTPSRASEWRPVTVLLFILVPNVCL